MLHKSEMFLEICEYKTLAPSERYVTLTQKHHATPMELDYGRRFVYKHYREKVESLVVCRWMKRTKSLQMSLRGVKRRSNLCLLDCFGKDPRNDRQGSLSSVDTMFGFILWIL